MKRIILLLCLASVMPRCFAQGVNFIVSYPVAFPTDNLNDYVGATSWRGVSLEVNRVQTRNIEVGIETAWNVFYERENSRVYTNGTVSIKGAQFRYVNTVPIIAQARYAGSGGNFKAVKPYVGVGVGTLYVNQATDFGLYRIVNEAWQFCLRPELGIQIKNQNGPGGFIGVKYYMGFDAADLDGQSYFTVNIGIILPTVR